MPRRALVLAICASGAATLPIFLLGTLALRVRSDLNFDEAAFGLASTARFVVTALSAALAGRAAQRFGAGRAIQTGVIVTAVSLVGVGLAPTYGALIPFIGLSGLGTAILMPATDLWLSERIPREKQGLAFGFKQAGQPTAALLAGIALPVAGATIGWRGAFVVVGVAVALLAFGISATQGGQRPQTVMTRDGDVSLGAMLTMALAIGFGSMCVSVIGSFLVSAAVESGISEGWTGVLFAVGSVMGIAARVIAGRRADQRARSLLGGAATMLAAGAVGYALLATMRPALVVLAIPFVFAGGWGWTGLYSLAVVRTNPNAPAAAIGITQTGASIGAVAGPSVFGVLAASSYTTAWTVTATASTLSALTMLGARRQIRRQMTIRRAAEAAPRTLLLGDG